LIIACGAGVAGAINAGGAIKTTDSTASTTTGTGSIIAGGGLGVGGSINYGALSKGGSIHATGDGTSGISLNVADAGVYAGMAVQDGVSGWSLGASTTIAVKSDANTYHAIGLAPAKGLLYFARSKNGPNTLNSYMTVDEFHQVALFSTNTSISTATGALTVPGGVGISGNTHVGGNIVASSGSITDSAGHLRRVPQNSQGSAYTLVVGDLGKHISISTGGVTVPANIFSAGDVVTIYNNSASTQTITQGTSLTLRLAGTATTGNRSLALRGVSTILFISATEAVINGGGLT
jgi:hypothetical protein